MNASCSLGPLNVFTGSWIGVGIWVASWIACGWWAKSRGYVPYHFSFIGFLLGLPGLILTVLATWERQPRPEVADQLRLGVLWARTAGVGQAADASLAPLLDENDPELSMLYHRASVEERLERFLPRLASHFALLLREAGHEGVYLLATMLVYLVIKAVFALGAVGGLDLHAAARFADPMQMAILLAVDVAVPSLIYLALRGPLSRTGPLGRMHRMVLDARAHSLLSMHCAAGLPLEEAAPSLQRLVRLWRSVKSELPPPWRGSGDVQEARRRKLSPAVGTERVCHGLNLDTAEAASTEEAERLSQEAYQQGRRLSRFLIIAYIAAMLVYMFLAFLGPMQPLSGHLH